MTPDGQAHIGQPIPRIDGARKVTGTAPYTVEQPPAGLLYGEVVQSRIAHGRIRRIDAAAAAAMPGVHLVLTHENAPRLPWVKNYKLVDPATGEPERPLLDDRVMHQGQHVALVVADTPEIARAAAGLVDIDYEPEEAIIALGEAVGRALTVHGAQEEVQPGRTSRGDPRGAFEAAPVKLDATYVMPRETQNPMEPHATIAAWSDGGLTLWDKTQWTQNCAETVARAFGLAPDQVRVICPFVGGAFGSALRVWPHTYLAAMAARVVGRPVRIELSRRQYYGGTGARPWTQLRVRLAATRKGELRALLQDAIGETSLYEDYVEATLRPVRVLYDIDNLATHYRLAKRAVNTPNAMRAPGETTGLFALECAMDEMAVALAIDPVDLRLRNLATRDRFEDKPFTSNHLADALRQGADRFNWAERQAAPASLHEGRLLRGLGMAVGAYPVNIAPATARAVLGLDGMAEVSLASSDMGPGTWTSLTQVAADALGLPMERVRLLIGDSALPRAPVHGGSMTMASAGHAVRDACLKLRAAAERASNQPDLLHIAGHLQAPIAVEGAHDPGDLDATFSPWSFGAVFAEVVVDPDLFEIHVRRVVGAYTNGRIINPLLARSQCMGGFMMGIGQALMEHTEIDERSGRIVNANLAEYLVPVMADTPEMEVIFVADEDPHLGPLAAKGIGEIALCGIGPAIVNAVWHATGKRLRTLPLTPDRLAMA